MYHLYWSLPSVHKAFSLCVCVCVCVCVCARVLCAESLSCVQLCDSMGYRPPGSSVHGGSPGKNTGVGCHFLFWGSPQLMDRTQVSRIADRFFTVWATKEALPVCVCVCVCTQISPFYKDSSYTDLGASSAPDDFIKLITSAKNLVPSKSHSGALGVRIAIYGFLGDN